MAEKQKEKEIELITVRIRRSDLNTMEGWKDHPRQPLYEVVSEVVGIVSKSKRGSR